jgi:hypothetical protein
VKTEKKLVTYCFVSVLVGVAAVAPLLFFMPGTVSAQTEFNRPWFNLDVPFAYYSATSTEGTSVNVDTGQVENTSSYSSAYSVGLNYSVNAAADTMINARIEYFKIHVYSDLGSIEDIVTSIGANCTGDMDPEKLFSFARDDWFNTNMVSGGTFYPSFNGELPENEGPVGGISGISTSVSFANITLPQEFLNAQNAPKIYIDISRLGYITFDGNNTIATLADQSILQHLELTKNGDNFTFGNVPANQIPTPGPIH